MKKLFSVVAAVFVFILAGVMFNTVNAQEEQYFPQPDLTNPQAPFIFTYDYAIAQGATAEWRKQEGVVIDAANQKMYMAVTRIRNGMSDGEGDIRLDENPCGMVMVGDLDASWNVTELTPLIIGGPFDSATETCALDNISEPDNVFADANGDLWITEDTDLHAHNMVWKYVVSTGELLRFATLPLGSEGTGLRITPNNQLMLNVQHPDNTNTAPFDMGTVGIVNGYVPTDSFEPVGIPEGDAELVLTMAAGEYQVLGRAGDAIPGSEQVFGELFTLDGTSLGASAEEVCNDPDGNMFIPSNEEGTEAILYTNWECAPGAVSRISLSMGEDGLWTVADGGYMVDFASTMGTLYNCNASVTPWNTGLTSEEDAVLNAEDWYADYAEGMNAFVGGTANPYDYGYIVELIPTEDGGTEAVKHYAMGRRENEQSWVAPDSRTVYFGDDGTDKVFYRFVATNEGDLSAGTLYAAKLTQTGTDGASDFAFQIEWIELGTSSNAEVEAAIRALDAAN